MKPSTVRWVRIGALSALGLLLLVFTYALRAVFIPVLAAALLAYILDPVVNGLERMHIRRSVGVGAIYALLLIAILGVLLLLVPLLYAEIHSVASAMAGEKYEDLNNNGRYDPGELFTDENGNGVYDPGYIERARGWLAGKVDQWNQRYAGEPGKQINIANLTKAIREQSLMLKESASAGASATQWVFRVLSSGVRRAVLLISAIILIPVYAFFLLLGMNRIWESFKEHLPGRQRDRILDVLGKIHSSTSAFFRGRLIICLIVAALTAIGLFACGVRLAFVLGLVVGIGSLIPFIGVLSGLIPAALLAYADHGFGTVIAVVIIFLVIHVLEGMVLTPLIIGKKVQLHPVTIILAIFVAAETLGFFGVLLAVPLVSTLKILAQEFVLPQLRELAKEVPEKRATDAP